MRTNLQSCSRDRLSGSLAFTLTEALVAMAVAGVMFVALYSGMATTTFSVRLARENLRATQIMLEKMEVIRLLTWEQITTSNILPSTFTASYYPPVAGITQTTNLTQTTNVSQAASGITYSGAITIQPFSPTNKVYSANMKRITVNVSWKSGSMARSRQLTTYVARYGIQNYIFN